MNISECNLNEQGAGGDIEMMCALITFGLNNWLWMVPIWLTILYFVHRHNKGT